MEQELLQTISQLCDEIKSLREDISQVKKNLKVRVPKFFTIGQVSRETGRPRQTIYKHLYSKKHTYEPEVDYMEKNGIIVVTGQTFAAIKENYGCKN